LKLGFKNFKKLFKFKSKSSKLEAELEAKMVTKTYFQYILDINEFIIENNRRS
jgi:hypothetical protein